MNFRIDNSHMNRFSDERVEIAHFCFYVLEIIWQFFPTVLKVFKNGTEKTKLMNSMTLKLKRSFLPELSPILFKNDIKVRH